MNSARNAQAQHSDRAHDADVAKPYDAKTAFPSINLHPINTTSTYQSATPSLAISAPRFASIASTTFPHFLSPAMSNAVCPCTSTAVTAAPLSINSTAHSRLRLNAATISGVDSSNVRASISAPRSNNNDIISMVLSFAAECNAVHPNPSRPFNDAPLSNASRAFATSPVRMHLRKRFDHSSLFIKVVFGGGGDWRLRYDGL